jgi:hypothetical protein
VAVVAVVEAVVAAAKMAIFPGAVIGAMDFVQACFL